MPLIQDIARALDVELNRPEDLLQLVPLAEKLVGEHIARLHAYEMRRLIAQAAGVKNVGPSILSDRQNGDGLRHASGPGSFEAAYQAALQEKKMRECSSSE